MSAWTEIASSCENPRPIYIGNRAEQKYMRASCGRWRCKPCGKHKAGKVAKRMSRLDPTHLVTVSLRRAASLADAPELHARLRPWLRWLQRQPWGLVHYGWVLELGEQTGQLHLHFVARFRSRWLPYSKIQAAAERAGIGVPDFEQIFRAEGAVRYVTKYITKGLDADLAARTRRFGITPGAAPAVSNPDWQIVRNAAELGLVGGNLRLVLASPMYAAPFT